MDAQIRQGKTSRMIRAANKAFRAGEKVLVIVATRAHAQQVRPRLDDGIDLRSASTPKEYDRHVLGRKCEYHIFLDHYADECMALDHQRQYRERMAEKCQSG